MNIHEVLNGLPIVPRFMSESGATWSPLRALGIVGLERDWAVSEVPCQPGDPSGCRVFELAPITDGGFRDEPGAIFVAG